MEKLVLFVALASLAAVYAQGPSTTPPPPECHAGAAVYTPDIEPAECQPSQLCVCPRWHARRDSSSRSRSSESDDSTGSDDSDRRRRRSADDDDDCPSLRDLMIEPGELCRCMPHCEDCESDAFGCDLCEDGYFFNETECAECGEHCVNCTDEETCNECEAGYFVNDDGACEECMDNCITCVDNSTCEECDSGFYYNDTEPACMECMEGCAVCSNDTACEECFEGYTYDDAVPECVLDVGPCTEDDWSSCSPGHRRNQRHICEVIAGVAGCRPCDSKMKPNSDKSACECKSRWADDGNGGCTRRRLANGSNSKK